MSSRRQRRCDRAAALLSREARRGTMHRRTGRIRCARNRSRVMMKRLGHTTLVFAMLMALLSAPCLSVLGVFGTGGVHAHFAGAAHHGAHDHKAHGARHAGMGHDPSEVQEQPIAGVSHDPAHHQLNCCGLCDGWRTASGRDLILSAAAARLDPTPVKAEAVRDHRFAGLAGASPTVGPLPPSPYLLARQTAGKNPPYAATQRLRI